MFTEHAMPKFWMSIHSFNDKGLISFISVAEACPGELACISCRFECGNVCWFAYGNGSFRKLNNDELTDYFGRGIFFPTKSYLTMMGSDMNIKKN